MSEVQRPELDRKDLLKRALVRMEQLEAELRAERARASEPLAIVGIGCRFPGGANDPETFWNQLIAGFDATSEIPADRWDVDAYYDPDPDTPGTMYVRRGAFISQPVDAFDAGFFGIAPREADELDPQQRLLAEVVWETLERAGHSPASLRDSATGVYLGMCAHDWSRLQGGAGDTGGIGTYFGTGTAHSVAAGRIAYLLGLRGPALTIDTACSSSLVAFHVACQSLRAAETRMAIVCGVSLILAPDGHVIASRGRMLSRNGRCSTFDASADGYVRGEGCAVVLVKRLSDARADGDNILAVVHGTASNQDGRSSGLTAPSGVAQEEVMRAALAASRLQPADIAYVETHGTGTELGDPIEVHALASVHADRPANRPLLIGSVKTNVGHLEAAAGLAGLIKTVLALRADVIPPHLHFRTPNPHIAWGAAPIQVAAAATPWPEGRRLAGLSSFGFSGTNAHVILEAATEDQRVAAAETSLTVDELIVPLSARTMDALRQLAGRHAGRIENDPALSIRDFARTLARGRAHWEHRAVVIAADRSALLHTLRELERGGSADVPGLLYGEANLKRAPRVAFLFTGQGSQRPGMGRDLLAASPVFRDAVEQCDRLLAPKLGFSVRDLLAADPADERTAELLQQTHITQPALFTLEYGLAMLWRSWGVEPSVMLGHSIGEYVAACVAGVLSLEDAVALIAERGRLMGSLPAGGAMATVFASEDVVRARLGAFGGKVDIAALNAPRSTVVSGDADAVDELLEQLHGAGIESRRLVVSHAFHSHRMEPILDAFRAVARVQHAAPRVDVIANVTGARATAETFGADYWARHVRSPVLFAKSIEALRAEGVNALIEAGPAPVLLGLTAACPGAPADELHLPTLRPGHRGVRSTWEALARLYIAGANIDWSRVYPGPVQATDLPTYPFQRQRHWFSTKRATAAVKDAVHPLLGRRIESPRFAGVIFETVLHEQSPAWLSEHRVFGRAVVPAAAFLEMARAAVEHATETAARLTGIRIVESLVVDNERTVQTIVDTSARTVEIVSRQADDVWRTHVTGRFDAELPQAESSIVEALQDSVEVEPATLLARIAASGVSYGPSFSGLRRIRRSSGYVLAEITGAAVATRERQTYAMHPALLDAAFQACGAFIDTGEDIYLPVEVGAVRTEHVGTHAAETVTAQIRVGAGGVGAPALVCDVNISDGRTSLHIEGLRFSRARQPGSAADRRAADWLYSWNWVDADVPAAKAGAGNWRILGNDDDVDAITDILQRAGRTVESAKTRDLAATSLNGTALEGVLFVVPQSKLPPRGEDIGEALEPVLLPLLETARAIAAGAAVGCLCVITRDAWPLDGDTVADPAAAASWGLGRTIAAELSGMHCRFIDIPATESLDRLADDVVNAVLMPGAEDRLALRADGWKAARLARLPKADTHIGAVVLSNAVESAPTNDAVWITGGLGGVGLAIAQRLVRDGARRIALTGRSAPSADAEQQIDAMRAAGAEVAILRGDVSRLDEVTRIRDEIAARGWRLQHVHHAAGVLDDAALAGQNLSRVKTALAPKAGGAWNLHLATLQLPLASFVLYSAGAALLGSRGQANYAAANAFLDGLAVHRRGLGLPAASIAWGPWADVGMAARAKLDWSATGVGAIDPDAGAAALKRVVRENIVLSAVLPIDWSRFPVQAASGEVHPFFSLIEANARDTQRVVADQRADWRALLNDTPPTERAERVQQLVADEVMRVLGLDRSRVLNKRQGLTDLGMDSLMAVELSNRLGRATATRLPSTLVFEHPTVEAMGAHVLAVLNLEIENSAPAEPVRLDESDLAEMSADDLALALADELKQIGY